MFTIAVLQYSPGVVYYQLLLRREMRVPRVATALIEMKSGIFLLYIWERSPIYAHP